MEMEKKLNSYKAEKYLCLCFLSFFVFSGCYMAEFKKNQYPVSPKSVIQKYLQALKVNDREGAGQYLINLSILSTEASKPCTMEVGRLIRDNSQWQIRSLQEEKKNIALFEITFDQPDLQLLLSKLSHDNFIAALGQGIGSASEKLCEIVAQKLAALSKADIDSLPRKKTTQYFTLKEVENQWKIAAQTNAKP